MSILDPVLDRLRGAERRAMTSPYIAAQLSRSAVGGWATGEGGTGSAFRRNPVVYRCVLLGGALQGLTDAPEGLPLQVHIRFGPRDMPTDSYAWQGFDTKPERRGLRCLSPVHVHIAMPKGPQSDWHFSWIRRSRIGGDDFDAPEVPLGEPEELYRVNFFANGHLMAHRDVTQPITVLTAKQRQKMFTQSRRARRWQIHIHQLNASRTLGDAAVMQLPEPFKPST